mgnify:CR=1 FL=1
MMDTKINTQNNTKMTPVISLKGVSKWYGDFQALSNIDLEIKLKEKIVICGPSGSGKSTLIRCINRLEAHQEGKIHVSGIELHERMKDIDIVRQDIGMVFQNFNLFPHLTVLENCMAGPNWVRGIEKNEAKERAIAMLEQVKIPEQADKYPEQLSGGQQQRVAIARSFVNDPAIILADEPTGNLDTRTGEQIISKLSQMSQDRGVTIITATHDHKMLSVSDRVVTIQDDQIAKIELRSDLNIKVGSIE